MAPEDEKEPLLEQDKLVTAISDIIKGIAQSSQEEKKEVFEALLVQVKEMGLTGLDLVINDQGLQKKVNKELFIKFVEEAFENLSPEDINLKIIKDALKFVEYTAINNNKGPLDNLVNYFKSASANEKIGIASAVIVLGAALSPLIMLATLIALVAIGARYAGIGIGRAGEKIKEGAIEAGKAVKSSYKDLIDMLPILTMPDNNLKKLQNNLMEQYFEANEEEKNNAW